MDWSTGQLTSRHTTEENDLQSPGNRKLPIALQGRVGPLSSSSVHDGLLSKSAPSCAGIHGCRVNTLKFSRRGWEWRRHCTN